MEEEEKALQAGEQPRQAKSWNDDKLWDGDVTESDSGVVPMLVEHNSDQVQDKQMWQRLPQVVWDKPKFKN